MHRCLRIQDVVEVIFSYLEPRLPSPGVIPQTWEELARLARTCKDFHNPALDCLWRSATLGNLLRCLPPDLCVVDELSTGGLWGETYSLRFIRPIQSNDWERVKIYAPRVQKLYALTNDNLSAIFPTLSQCLPQALFCNLQSFVWWYPHSFQYIQLFLGPHLTSLEIGTPIKTDSDLALFSTLAPKCPRLKNLRVASRKMQETEVGPEAEAISLFVQGLQSIESVSVHLLDQVALGHVRTLPTLKSLTLDTLPAGLTFSSVDDPTLPAPFVALASLRLYYTDIKSTTRFLSDCGTLPLTLFSVTVPALQTKTALHDLVSTVASTVLPTTLTAFNVHNHGQYDFFVGVQSPTDHCVLGDSLHLLLSFVNLTSVTITSPGSFDLDNDTVIAMTRAWPRIEVLHLCSVFPVQPPRATLECLPYFLHSLMLRTLAITVDCSAVPVRSDDSGSGSIAATVSSHPLVELDLSFSPLSPSTAGAVNLAQFISEIFPALRGVRTAWDIGDTESYALYQQVLRYRPYWRQVDAAVRGDPIPSANFWSAEEPDETEEEDEEFDEEAAYRQMVAAQAVG
ncbi:hypothetical protein B0H16DRAFT_1712566 [Mycena metata]|uniref:F-box domain-containing protein n=1 Tax=Mycena metata TaxID=1033252 RepID=A0AAD7NV70_9AGAR|nr:hypothetical protein B0H16DRAFT_1712566 [Mycena metata]